MLCADLLDESGILTIINVGAERDFLDGEPAGNLSSFNRIDRIGFAQDRLQLASNPSRRSELDNLLWPLCPRSNNQ